MVYKQLNTHYKGNNLTVDGGETRSFKITKLDPYTVYDIWIQAFTSAGVSPTNRTQKGVRTQEDGMFKGVFRL